MLFEEISRAYRIENFYESARIHRLKENVENLENELKNKYDLEKLSLSQKGSQYININTIVVSKDKRNQNIGSKVIKDIINYADNNGKIVTLDIADRKDNMGTTSKKRLINFYKSLGFVENKGRNKDFEISASMYRPLSSNNY